LKGTPFFAPMKRPRFEPYLQTGTHMIEI